MEWGQDIVIFAGDVVDHDDFQARNLQWLTEELAVRRLEHYFIPGNNDAWPQDLYPWGPIPIDREIAYLTLGTVMYGFTGLNYPNTPWASAHEIPYASIIYDYTNAVAAEIALEQPHIIVSHYPFWWRDPWVRCTSPGIERAIMTCSSVRTVIFGHVHKPENNEALVTSMPGIAVFNVSAVGGNLFTHVQDL
jgi:3',5'-cyclic AMP phosphodiesterase CpdA